METSQQTDCTSTFVPSPSRSRSLLLLLFFFEREGREGGGSAEPTAFRLTNNYSQTEERKKINSCEVSLRLRLLWHRLSLPTGLYPPVGGGWSRSSACRRKRGWPDASQAVCRALLQTGRAHPETHSRLWRCTMEESPVYTVLSEHRSILADWRHSYLVNALIYRTVHCLDSRGFNKRFYVFDGRRRTF